MGPINMDIGSYEIEYGEAVATGYGDEILCTGWIPGLACQQSHTREATLPAGLAGADVDAFLRKIYSCQR